MFRGIMILRLTVSSCRLSLNRLRWRWLAWVPLAFWPSVVVNKQRKSFQLVFQAAFRGGFFVYYVLPRRSEAFVRGRQDAISAFPSPARSRPAQRPTDARTKRSRQDACRHGNTCFCTVTILCDYR